MTWDISKVRLHSPKRASRLVLARTIRDLRRSVAQRRPMSLPNLLRLYQRRMAMLSLSDKIGADRLILERVYRQHQPFSGGARGILL